MNIARVFTVLRARLWLIVLAAIVTAATAYATAPPDRGPRVTYRGAVQIDFTEVDALADFFTTAPPTTVDSFMDEAEELALSREVRENFATRVNLDVDAVAGLFEFQRSGFVFTFSATNPAPETATELAKAAAQAYIDVRLAITRNDVERQLDSVLDAIEVLDLAIDELYVPPAEVDPQTQQTIQELIGFESAYETQLNQLIVDLAIGPDPTLTAEEQQAITDDLETDIETVRARLDETRQQLIALGVDPSADTDPAPGGVGDVTVETVDPIANPELAALTGLQTRRAELQTQYDDLIVQTRLPPTPDRYEELAPVEVRQATLETTVRVGIAALIGLILGILAAIIWDRVERPVWSRRDLERLRLPVLEVVADGPRRARDAQLRRLRAAIEFSVLREDKGAVGFAPVATRPARNAALVLTLGRMTQAAGTDVILVDAELDRRDLSNDLGLALRPGLGELPRVNDQSVLSLAADELLRNAPAVAEGVRVLPAGTTPGRSEELLDGPGSRVLFARLRTHPSLPLVTLPEGRGSAGSLSMRLVDHVVLVATRAGTREGDLERIAHDLEQTGRPKPWVVLLTRPLRARIAGLGSGGQRKRAVSSDTVRLSPAAPGRAPKAKPSKRRGEAAAESLAPAPPPRSYAG